MKFNKSYKSQAAMFGATALALTVSASSHAALTLMANGDFEAGSADWGIFESAPGDVSFEATGGNGGGFGFVNNTSGGWGGGFVQPDTAAPIALADWGLSGGDTTAFSFDVKDFNGDGLGVTGIKFESWTATGVINDTGDIHFAQSDALWNTVVTNYTFDAAATHFKVVLVGTNAGQVGFDNLMIDAGTVVPVPAAAWLFGSALAGLVAVRRRK